MTARAATPSDTDGASLVVREATPADDARICAQMRRTAMAGRVSLTMSHDPSFFASAEVEGHACRVAVAERAGEIVGVGLLARRRVYLDGEPAEVGYISSLRTDPSIRSTRAFLQGSRLFRKWHEEEPAPFYLAAILKDNAFARRLLTSGHAGLPTSVYLGDLYTASIPLLWRPTHGGPDGLRIVRGPHVGAEAVAEALRQYGRTKQLFPVYTREDLEAEGGLLRGLGVEDFHVALAGERVVGVLASWDQSAFRRLVVAGYAKGLRMVRPALSALSRALGVGPLPTVGGEVRSLTAACLAIENNDPEIFRSLLDAALRAGRGSGHTFLLVGLMEQDPLLAVVRQYRHWPTRSCLYAQQWGARPEAGDLEGRIPYVELASL